MTAIANRYEFALLFDIQNGNPNGDPDAGNMPRIDPETGHGLVTDVCLKRKIRNHIALVQERVEGYQIYIQEKAVLNQTHALAYKAFDLSPEKKKLPKKTADALNVTGWMCANFYDIRSFGAVMTTEINCGQVRGPVQLAFAKSVEPIVPQEISITRMAVTNEKDLEKERTMEEMLGHRIDGGALFYGKTRRRQDVIFDDALRSETEQMAARLHALFDSKHTPEPVFDKRCPNCSFISYCLPEKLSGGKSAARYIQKIREGK